MYKHPLFFDAVERWLANPRKYELTRDVGDCLSATEYTDDLNLHGDYGDTIEDEPTLEDRLFIDDTSLLEIFSAAGSDSSLDELPPPIDAVPFGESDDESSAPLRSELVLDERNVITESEEEAQESDAETDFNGSAATVGAMIGSLSA